MSIYPPFVLYTLGTLYVLQKWKILVKRNQIWKVNESFASGNGREWNKGNQKEEKSGQRSRIKERANILMISCNQFF